MSPEGELMLIDIWAMYLCRNRFWRNLAYEMSTGRPLIAYVAFDFEMLAHSCAIQRISAPAEKPRADHVERYDTP